MGLSINSHIKFYQEELRVKAKKWDETLKKRVCDLLTDRELFIGVIQSFNDDNGFFTLKIRQDYAPRQNTPYFMGLIRTKALPTSNPLKWIFTYDDFRKSRENGIWFDRVGGDIYITKCFKIQDGFAYYYFDVPESEVRNDFKTYLEIYQSGHVLIAESDPPINYLKNLQSFVSNNSTNPILNIPIEGNLKNWGPKLIDNEIEISDEIDLWFDSSDIVIVQGPPGTGKSYNAALYVNQQIKKNKSVCICSLANKALMEFTSQDGMRELLHDSVVYKTNLTEAESRRIPQLKPLTGDLIPHGNVLLATYYKLSEIADDLIMDSRRFDLLIIEEASQAFLATIALFSSIAKKILLIGDPMQLAPIVESTEKRLLKIDESMPHAWNGMLAVGRANEKNSYRLTKTRRLTEKAAIQTGYFYEGTLKSVSTLNTKPFQPSILSRYFNNQGGSSLLVLPIADSRYGMSFVKRTIETIVKEIIQEGSRSAAVLVQTKKLEIELTQALVKFNQGDFELTISTVHKIQGITVDYTILYLPLKNFKIELDGHFFNVATSRAKKGTLLIIPENWHMFSGISKKVSEFLSSAEKKALENP